MYDKYENDKWKQIHNINTDCTVDVTIVCDNGIEYMCNLFWKSNYYKNGSKLFLGNFLTKRSLSKSEHLGFCNIPVLTFVYN